MAQVAKHRWYSPYGGTLHEGQTYQDAYANGNVEHVLCRRCADDTRWTKRVSMTRASNPDVHVVGDWYEGDCEFHTYINDPKRIARIEANIAPR